jgi:hypothetical protein
MIMLKKLIAALAVAGSLAISGVAVAPTAIGNWPDPMSAPVAGSAKGGSTTPMIGNWPDPM